MGVCGAPCPPPGSARLAEGTIGRDGAVGRCVDPKARRGERDTPAALERAAERFGRGGRRPGRYKVQGAAPNAASGGVRDRELPPSRRRGGYRGGDPGLGRKERNALRPIRALGIGAAGLAHGGHRRAVPAFLPTVPRPCLALSWSRATRAAPCPGLVEDTGTPFLCAREGTDGRIPGPAVPSLPHGDAARLSPVSPARGCTRCSPFGEVTVPTATSRPPYSGGCRPGDPPGGGGGATSVRGAVGAGTQHTGTLFGRGGRKSGRWI